MFSKEELIAIKDLIFLGSDFIFVVPQWKVSRKGHDMEIAGLKTDIWHFCAQVYYNIDKGEHFKFETVNERVFIKVLPE